MVEYSSNGYCYEDVSFSLVRRACKEHDLPLGLLLRRANLMHISSSENRVVILTMFWSLTDFLHHSRQSVPRCAQGTRRGIDPDSFGSQSLCIQALCQAVPYLVYKHEDHPTPEAGPVCELSARERVNNNHLGLGLLIAVRSLGLRKEWMINMLANSSTRNSQQPCSFLSILS